jgi:hypothetical protein
MDSVKTLEAVDGAGADVHEARPSPRVDATVFLGSWTSTNRDTQGISRLVIREKEGRLFVRAFGACVPSVCDWGEAAADVFADDPRSTRAYGFSARFDLGFKETSMQAKIEKGVLVVANFNRFKDGSGRANFFSREFFFRRPTAGERA